jgi:hypothetical protein
MKFDAKWFAAHEIWTRDEILRKLAEVQPVLPYTPSLFVRSEAADDEIAMVIKPDCDIHVYIEDRVALVKEGDTLKISRKVKLSLS